MVGRMYDKIFFKYFFLTFRPAGGRFTSLEKPRRIAHNVSSVYDVCRSAAEANVAKPEATDRERSVYAVLCVVAKTLYQLRFI